MSREPNGSLRVLHVEDSQSTFNCRSKTAVVNSSNSGESLPSVKMLEPDVDPPFVESPSPSSSHFPDLSSSAFILLVSDATSRINSAVLVDAVSALDTALFASSVAEVTFDLKPSI